MSRIIELTQDEIQAIVDANNVEVLEKVAGQLKAKYGIDHNNYKYEDGKLIVEEVKFIEVTPDERDLINLAEAAILAYQKMKCSDESIMTGMQLMMDLDKMKEYFRVKYNLPENFKYHGGKIVISC